MARFEEPVVDDSDASQVVVHGVVAVLHQAHPTGGHSHGTFRHIQRVQLNFRRTLRLESSFDSVAIQRRNLLGRRLGAVVEWLEHQRADEVFRLDFLLIFRNGVRILDKVLNFRRQIRPKRLHRRQVNAPVLAVDRSALHGCVVHVVEDAVPIGHAVDVDAVHPEHLDKQSSVEWRAWDVIQVDAGVRVVVPNVQAEVLVADPKGPHGIDVLHHHLPQRGRVSVVKLNLGHGGLQHLQNQGTRGRVPVLAQGSNLVRLAINGVFVGHGKHLGVVQRLAQGNEPKPRVEREFRLRQFAGIAHAFVVDALHELSSQGAHVGQFFVRADVVHDVVVRRQTPEQVVVVVVGRTVLGGRCG